MARNRVIYQSEALYVSSGLQSTATGSHAQLERVQSANYNFTINRQDINQYGQLSRIDSIVLEPPTVGLDFTYYLTDGFNERALGFNVVRETGWSVATTGANGAVSGFATGGYNNNGTRTSFPTSGSIASGYTGFTSTESNFPSGLMTSQQSGQNFYISTTNEGEDALGITGLRSVIGIGNAFLTNYSLELAVGSLPTVSVSMEAANMNSDATVGVRGSGFTGISGIQLPSVDPLNGNPYVGDAAFSPATSGLSNISALRPGDVTVNISAFDTELISDLGTQSATNADGIHIQSASLSIPLSRTPLQRLGTRFAYSRAVDFPLKPTLSVSAILNEVSAVNLATLINSSKRNNITLTINAPDGSPSMIYTLRGCTLDSESFSSSIGSNKSVELSFSTQIGGTNDTTNGVFVSGANRATPFF